MSKVELLAPGGSYDSVIAAFNAGADAVYTGGDLFGARASADNLTTEQLLDVIDYAHIHGRKLYLTVNTLLKDIEIEEQLYEYLLPLYLRGLDAVIVQDMGVLNFIKKAFPDLNIHASTQMTIFGKDTVNELKTMGVDRIVTPRELSLTEIKNIKNNCDIEIESFVHGALCYCYSGQCFLSSYIGGRSGNRGRCAQPCRMEYDVILEDNVLNPGNNKYVISPKDICTLNILPEIIESGVYSLKIEGRMKKLEYIAGVVSIYRKYLDLYINNPNGYKVDEKDLLLLNDLFNRNGFNESYYKQHNGRNMISLKKPEFRIENREFTDYLKTKYSGKILKKSIDIKVTCLKNKPFKLETVINDYLVSVEDEVPDLAQNRPIDKEHIAKQIGKVGNTDFVVGQLDIELEDGLFIPVGKLNDIRRRFIDKVRETVLCKFERVKTEKPSVIKPECNTIDMTVNVHVWTKEQLEAVLNYNNISIIYVEESEFNYEQLKIISDLIHSKGKKMFLALPYVFRKKVNDLFDKNSNLYVNIVDGFLIRNQEQYFALKYLKKDVVFDYGVYTLNKYAKEYYNRYGSTTAPLELNERELSKRGMKGDELLIYGYMPAMISAGCSLITCNMCTKSNLWYKLKDRKKNFFDTKCVCKYCYNVMFNCKPLSLLGYWDNINKLNPTSIRLSFTKESFDKTNEIMTKLEKTLVEGKRIVEDDSTTRGHFKRGII